MANIGKKEFIQHTSRYLKLAEETGKIIITHRNQPCMILTLIEKPSIDDLRGIAGNIEIEGDINEHALKGFEEW